MQLQVSTNRSQKSELGIWGSYILFELTAFLLPESLSLKKVCNPSMCVQNPLDFL